MQKQHPENFYDWSEEPHAGRPHMAASHTSVASIARNGDFLEVARPTSTKVSTYPKELMSGFEPGLHSQTTLQEGMDVRDDVPGATGTVRLIRHVKLY